MQIILTEEEYTDLKSKADKYKRQKSDNLLLQDKLATLQAKYNQLLVFGVSNSNERLKGKL